MLQLWRFSQIENERGQILRDGAAGVRSRRLRLALRLGRPVLLSLETTGAAPCKQLCVGALQFSLCSVFLCESGGV